MVRVPKTRNRWVTVCAVLAVCTHEVSCGNATLATSGTRFKAVKIRSYAGKRRYRDGPGPPDKTLRPRAHCDKVAVVTTISGPTPSIRKMMAATGWCTVIAGDAKTPGKLYKGLLNPKRHFYLSLAAQNASGYRLTAHTPLNHFSRKNIGYLHAVGLGASLVYDFDDDNELIKATIPEVVTTGIMPALHIHRHKSKAGHKREFETVNPCSEQFQTAGMWPRGYPLSRINQPHNGRWFADLHPIELGAVQSMANHDPDVDAIYRLAPRTSQPLPYNFRRTAQPLVLGTNLYAPFNAQTTLFTSRALWALYLPTTVHGRVSDIWRSYIAQRLFWTLGLHLAFHRPWVTQIRNSHDYLSDFMSERPLYETTEELLRVLHEWEPKKHGAVAIAENLESIYILLYEHGFVELADVEGVQLWLSDLAAIGYLDKLNMAPTHTPRVRPEAATLPPSIDAIYTANLTACDAGRRAGLKGPTGVDKDFLDRITTMQEPRDCSCTSPDGCPLTATFSRVPPGLGAALYHLALAVVIGSGSGGFRVVDTKGSLEYANEKLCPSQDLTCYFQPLSPCTTATSQLAPNNPEEFGVTSKTMFSVPHFAGNADSALAAAVAHVMRPKPSLLSFTDHLQEQIGLRSVKFVSVQMRTGGRFMGDGRKFPSVRQYAAWTVKAANAMNVRAAYVTTDLYDALPEFSRFVTAHGITVHYIPEALFRTDGWEEDSRIEGARARLYSDAPADFDYVRLILADWYIASRAEFFIWSYSLFGHMVWLIRQEQPEKAACNSYWNRTPKDVGTFSEYQPTGDKTGADTHEMEADFRKWTAERAGFSMHPAHGGALVLLVIGGGLAVLYWRQRQARLSNSRTKLPEV